MEITTFDKLSKEDQALVKTAMEARELLTAITK